MASAVQRTGASARRLSRDVAVVAHGHVLRALAARWVKQPAALGCRPYLETGSISVLGFERKVRVVHRWNT